MVNTAYYDSIFDIVEDYNDPSTTAEEKDIIFEELKNRIWKCGNYRTTVKKKITYKICNKIASMPEYTEIFSKYTEMEYTSYRHTSKRVGWENLIRQKINNIYSFNFDKNIMTDKRYKDLMYLPKHLYYDVVEGADYTPEYIQQKIDNGLSEANKLLIKNRNSKITLAWKEYIVIVNNYLRRILDNCQTEFDYDQTHPRDNYFEREWNADKLYVKYFCKSLECYFRNFKYEISGLSVPSSRTKNNYKTCQKCGKLFIVNSNSQKFCKNCISKPMVLKDIICIDCRKEFKISSKNNKTIRCKECQDKFDRVVKHNSYVKKYSNLQY